MKRITVVFEHDGYNQFRGWQDQRQVLILGDIVTIISSGEINLQVGKAEMRMTSDGFVRIRGDTLYLDFENGIEMVGGKEIAARAPKIKLN